MRPKTKARPVAMLLACLFCVVFFVTAALSADRQRHREDLPPHAVPAAALSTVTGEAASRAETPRETIAVSAETRVFPLPVTVIFVSASAMEKQIRVKASKRTKSLCMIHPSRDGFSLYSHHNMNCADNQEQGKQEQHRPSPRIQIRARRDGRQMETAIIPVILLRFYMAIKQKLQLPP